MGWPTEVESIEARRFQIKIHRKNAATPLGTRSTATLTSAIVLPTPPLNE